MESTIYSIALITRGAGAFAYSYVGRAGLEPGTLVAVPFQHRLELGLVMGLDPDPPAKQLLPLVPVEIERWPLWGRTLLELCELSVSAPDEIAGHLLFDSARNSLRLRLELSGEGSEVAELAAVSGKLTPTLQKAIVKQHWPALAKLQRSGSARLVCSIAGDPGGTKAPATWRKRYELDQADAALLGLPAAEKWAGAYLAGFDNIDLRKLAVGKVAADAQVTAASYASTLRFEKRELPECLKLTGERRQPNLRSAVSTWPALRAQDGLLGELSVSVHAGQRLLVIAPQAWVIERLWPLLSPLADYLSRFRAEAGPGVASQILRQLENGAHVVFGGPGAWKLAAYYDFDRILLIDPTHPQYAAERAPHLDPRLSVLLCAAAAKTSIDLVELGLDALDGSIRTKSIHIHEPYEPADTSNLPGLNISREDTDPLPLELRRPDRRRLIYFNRLGSGRGLYCGECWTAVNCPRCGSSRIHYAPSQSAYTCPECGLVEKDLRCPGCHLMALVSVMPGLESVTRRPGDLILHGPVSPDRMPAQVENVIGTSQMLDPLPGFWPQQVIYVHAEGRVGLLADWPAAVDMATRLAALYDNPELEGVHIVSAQLAEQLRHVVNTNDLTQRYSDELGLRELAGLPPFGTLYHLRAASARSGPLADARRHLGERLQGLPGTTLLRLGTSYRQGGAHRLAGWLLNEQATLRELQELRWELQRMDVTLSVHAIRGPWVW